MAKFTQEEQHVLIYLSCVLTDYKESVQRINTNPYFRHKICEQILKLHDLRLQMKMFQAFGLNAKIVDVRTVFLADTSFSPGEYCDRLEKVLIGAGEGLNGYSDTGIEVLNASLLLNVTANYCDSDDDEESDQ